MGPIAARGARRDNAERARHLAKLMLRHPLAAYYLATPLFVLADVGLGWPIRVSFLTGYPLLKYGYYVVCFSCGLLSLRRDGRFLPAVGLAESALNILMLVLSVMIPIVTLPRQVMAGEAVTHPFSVLFFVNFLISACVFLSIFYTNPYVRRSPRLKRSGSRVAAPSSPSVGRRRW